MSSSINGESPNDFDSAEIYKEMTEVTVDGNQFIKIPKFYIKKVVNGDTWEWYISKIKQDENYYLPACFYDEEKEIEIPYILVGKYDASLGSDNKLESKTGALPLVSKTSNQFREYAKNNGESYQLIDIHAIDILQVLFYIEYGTLNSQSIMMGYVYGQTPWTDTHKVVSVSGNNITITSNMGSTYTVNQLIDEATKMAGRDVVTNLKITAINGDVLTVEDTQWTDRKKTITVGNIIYNVSNINGTTDSITSSSGTINNNGEYCMKYRGIENLYGGVWQLVDGVNIDNGTSKIYVARNSKEYASDVITGSYKEVGYSKLNTEGWVTKMGYDSNNPFIQLPISVGGNDSSKYADYYYVNTTAGKKIMLFGDAWSLGTCTGISNFYVRNGSSDFTMNVGSRLIKTAF